MRPLASFLLIAFTLAAGAAETWRWKDENGVVHYSDRPAPGAERVNVGPASRPGSTSAIAPAARTAAPAAAQQASTTQSYSRCVIATPANDAVFNAVNFVDASVQIEPALQDGHRIQVILNGRAYPDWPEAMSSYTLSNLNRGSYSLSVRVLDADGRTLCNGSPSSFHVRQPSLLAPARPAARRP